jgi:hypothetical protein
VLAQMAADELIRARARRGLAGRQHPLPDWLRSLSATAVDRATEMSHVLGDGDNIMLGVRLPAGRELCAVIYIDHNLGTVVKDAFVVPGPISELLPFMQAKADDPDVVWRDVNLGDARARISEAIELGRITYPPFETDTWPACRPLVEWLARLLPEGGTGYVRPQWDAAALDDLAARFFASPFAAGLGDADHHSLLESILWFATDYGPGDPLRWSAVAVEILLTDWIPRKIMADTAFLSRAPELLRGFVRFCHDERGIRAALTGETIAAVDHFEPDYQRTIRSPRPQGPAALLAAMGALGLDAFGSGPDDERPWQQMMLDWLSLAVGGDDALQSLDDRPLPDEEFCWEQVPEDVHPCVAEILAACDSWCAQLPDTEYRTACRRLLALAASRGPGAFRRKARADVAAAGLCWLIGKANELFSPSGGGMRVKDLASHFGVQQGSISQRGGVLLKAAGIERSARYGDIELGSPRFLVSARRKRIIERRDRYLADLETESALSD